MILNYYDDTDSGHFNIHFTIRKSVFGIRTPFYKKGFFE